MSFKAYKLADILRTAVGAPVSHRHTTAIIAAAGSSTRMGSNVSKLLLEVDGIPVLARTLIAHQLADTVDEIVLIARREDFDTYLALAKQYAITKLKRITTGGSSRQESVLHGFEAVSQKTEFVAISDGARCLVTPDMIDMVNQTAWKHDAACAATPATDTIKLANDKGYTKKNAPERESVWLAQTPQTFALPLYRAAAYYAKENDYTATDDAALVEAIGRRVKLVDSGKENIKITTPADLYLAKAILQRRADEHTKKDGDKA